MANLPNDPVSSIAATADPNPDLPTTSFPSLARVVAGDLVGPEAANRQEASLEKRDETIRTQVNKLVALCNTIDTTFLRKTNIAGKDGIVGPTANISWNNKKITDLADGTITSGGNDAVNGGQLYTVRENAIACDNSQPPVASIDWNDQYLHGLKEAGITNGSTYAATVNQIYDEQQQRLALDTATKDAARLSTGTLAAARMGSGTANSTKYLRGDRTWQDLVVPVISDWTSVSITTLIHAATTNPVFTSGSGTCRRRRVGDSMELSGYFALAAGLASPGSGQVRVLLPDSVVIDTSKFTVDSSGWGGDVAGFGDISTADSPETDDKQAHMVVRAVTSTYLAFGLFSSVVNGGTNQLGDWLASGGGSGLDYGFGNSIRFRFRATVPIVGW